jgi:hypothetical protein
VVFDKPFDIDDLPNSALNLERTTIRVTVTNRIERRERRHPFKHTKPWDHRSGHHYRGADPEFI